MATIEMQQDIPAWAKRRVTPEEHSFSEVQDLLRQGRAEVQLPDLQELKSWARAQGWPTPWFGFKKAFLAKVFESQGAFALALQESGITVHIPIESHKLTQAKVKKLDALYEETEDMGALGRRPTEWGSLVSELREIRRLVEAGIEVKVEGTDKVLRTWQGFYSWAHGRYGMLEDGYDSWIGDDDS